MNQKMVVSAPYPEGASLAIARALSSAGELATMYMPSRVFARSLSHLIARTGRSPSFAARLLRGADGIDQLNEILPDIEIRRLLGSATRGRMPLTSLEHQKPRFDRAVAQSLAIESSAAALIAMPAAARTSFQAFQGLRVFLEVDGPPAARNKLLDLHYGATPEHVSKASAERIDQELQLADVVLSPSTIVSTQLLAAGVPQSRVIQIPYGVDFTRFAPPSGGTRRAGRVRVVYVGQIGLRKGIPFLINAVRGLEVDLHLVGPVVSKNLLRNLPSNVSYSPPVAASELAATYAAADAFVIASIEDNFALVVAEAVASGLPIISSSAVGASEYLAPGDVTLVTPGSSAELRDALQNVTPLLPSVRQARALFYRSSGSPFNSWADYGESVRNALGRRLSTLPNNAAHGNSI